MATNARAPIADTAPRLGTYGTQSLYDTIQRQMSARVEREIEAAGGNSFFGGFSDRPAQARAAVAPASKIITDTLMRHQQEDIAAASAAVTASDGEAQMDKLAAARAFEVRTALAGNRQVVAAFELTDAKLTEMTGVDAQGRSTRSGDTLFTQLQSVYANELGHQNNVAIAKLEAEAAKKTQVASLGETTLPPSAMPKAADKTTTTTAPPPVSPPAKSRSTSPQTTTAKTDPAYVTSGQTTDTAQAPTGAPADDATAKKLAELKARQARLAEAEAERQRAAERQQNTEQVGYTQTGGGESGGGGFMDTIMGWLGGMTESWNENVGGPMKRGANALNRKGLGWLGPLAILGIALAGAFGGMGMAALLLVGFMVVMAVSGSSMFNGGAQAGEPGSSPAGYDQQQPQAGRDGPIQNINYESPGMSPLVPNGGAQRPPRER